MRPKHLTLFWMGEDNPAFFKDGFGFLLEQQASFNRFMPCPVSQMKSAGFVPPQATPDMPYAMPVAKNAYAVCLQTEERLVSGKAIAQALYEEVRNVEQVENRTMKGPERKRRKERLTLAAMEKAQTVKRKTLALIDPVGGVVAVDAASVGQAEEVLTWLRKALQTFPVRGFEFAFEGLQNAVMNRWAFAPGSLPDGLEYFGYLSLKIWTAARRRLSIIAPRRRRFGSMKTGGWSVRPCG